MAMKLVSRAEEPKEEKSWGSLARTLTNTGLSLAGSIPQFAQSVGRSLADLAPSRRGGMPELTQELYEGPSVTQELRSATEKSQGLAKGSLEPQGFIEKTINKTAESFPLTATLGAGSLGSKVAADLASSAGMTAAEDFGFGPIGQVIGGVLGSSIFGKAKNFLGKGTSLPKLEELANTAKTRFYDTEAKLGSKINVPSKKYVEGLEKIGEKIIDNTALSLSEKQDLVSKINQFTTDASSGKLNAAKLVQREKELNALWPQIQGRKNSVFRQFVGETRNLIENTGKEIGKKHPEWMNSWQSAKDIVKAQNYKSTLSEMLEENPILGKSLSKPLVKNLLGLSAGSFAGGLTGGAAGVAGTMAFNKGERLWGYYNRPAGKKLLQEAFKNIIDRNAPALERSLLKLNKDVERYEKEEPARKPGRLRLISRSGPV